MTFSGVTKCGRVWRKVPESGARSVGTVYSQVRYEPAEFVLWLSLSLSLSLDSRA